MVTTFPAGAVVNALAVCFGGLCGLLAGSRLPKRVADALPGMLALGALYIGVTQMSRGTSIPVVVLSLLLGGIGGHLLCLEQRLYGILQRFGTRVRTSTQDEHQRSDLVNAVVIFCFSGTGIFGAILGGISGDHSVLMGKAVLDFFTAGVFAVSLGPVVVLASAGQLMVQLLLHAASMSLFPALGLSLGDVLPFVGNFQAVGGLITFAIGLKLLRLADIKVLNLVPAFLMYLPCALVGSALPV